MNINFILVEPKVPENIGASARAIKTMGFSSLHLINPCPDKEGRAKWLAHGSADILENAKIYNNLDEALVDSELVVATTARKRGIKKDVINLRELPEFISKRQIAGSTTSIVFGREESGLTNSEIKLCDIASYIPMALSYPSLNLAQAVMIYAFELSGLSGTLAKDQKISGISNLDSLRAVKPKVEKVLEFTGISKNHNLAGRIMERISLADEKDIKLIHSVAGAIIDKIK